MYVLLLLIGIYSFSFQGVDTQNTVLFPCQSILGLHILRVDFFPFITLMGFEERNNFVD